MSEGLSIWGMLTAQDDLRCRKRARNGAGRRYREKDAPGFERFEDYLIRTIASWLDEMRGIGKALPRPSANHRAGELNASLATVLGLDAKPIDAGALYGPALSAGVIANAAV